MSETIVPCRPAATDEKQEEIQSNINHRSAILDNGVRHNKISRQHPQGYCGDNPFRQGVIGLLGLVMGVILRTAAAAGQAKPVQLQNETPQEGHRQNGTGHRCDGDQKGGQADLAQGGNHFLIRPELHPQGHN